jgi:hypothetical protein
MSSWHELVIEGPERIMRAFVVGFVAGRGERSGGVFGSDVGLQQESFGERLKALFAAGSHHVFLAPERLTVPLADALAQHGADVGLRLEHRRVVESAAFTFRAEVYSRDLAAEIRALLAALPAGVRLEDLSEAEEAHPEAHGPEPFAPLHEYVFRVSGRIGGSVEDVLRVWDRTHDRDFLEIGEFRIVAR